MRDKTSNNNGGARENRGVRSMNGADAAARLILDGAGLEHAVLLERFNPASPRLIYKIRADGRALILKCIPDDVGEDVIEGNVSAHEFLGANALAPALVRFPRGERYVRANGFWAYLFEFIDGRQLTDSVEDMETLGALARRLHSLSGYSRRTWFNGDRTEYYGWFADRPFKREFDRILDTLPDFGALDQCFIHTDIGPHNAMMMSGGSGVGDCRFIDLDDAGVGCRCIDLGFPFIMQVARMEGGAPVYNFDAAAALLRGYYGGASVTRGEYDRIWDGAVLTHISYMKVFGEGADNDMWRLLRFGMEQKEALWKRLRLSKK